jgi:hypothetical protein
MLHKIHEVHKKEDWEILRGYNYRYDGEEKIEGGMARVDLFDEETNTKIAVYCPVKLLPTPDFWFD